MSLASRNRQGTAAVLICVLMVPLLSLMAFSIDYGYLLFIRTELQRTADQAALAAVRDLTPDSFGNQNLDLVRATVRTYVQQNLGSSFEVLDSDIEIGRYNPSTIYGDIELLSSGILDTVRVNLRRDDVSNTSVSLYFARVFNRDEASVSATSTAVLQRARYLGPGTGVLPITIELKGWNKLNFGDVASIYGDGRIENESGGLIAGNWGTVDIGPNSNSSDALATQIVNGLTQSDLDAMYRQRSIPTNEYIDASLNIDINGDTGLSAGLRHPIEAVTGQNRVAPIYKGTTSKGGSLEFQIVGWVVVRVEGSSWNGSKNSSIEIRKSFVYDEDLRPVTNLSDTSNVIEGAYTSPVLVK